MDGFSFFMTNEDKIKNWNQLLSNYWKSHSGNQFALLQDRIHPLEKRHAHIIRLINDHPLRADATSLKIEADDLLSLIGSLTKQYEQMSERAGFKA